ncbi:MAG: hypothetical protein HQL46_15035 [Gammaproteobacteria bacterium]|nr:hypothetical protein [Gammaproteobacteria bacterium]
MEQQARLDELGINYFTFNHCDNDQAVFDPMCIRQVITNFLSSAIKFTGKGKRIDFDLSSSELTYILLNKKNMNARV